MTVAVCFARPDHGPGFALLHCGDCGYTWVDRVDLGIARTVFGARVPPCPPCADEAALQGRLTALWRPEDDMPSGWLVCPQCGLYLKAHDRAADDPVHGSCCGVHGPDRRCNGRLLEVSRGEMEREWSRSAKR